jgi:prevent-host-death family protein
VAKIVNMHEAKTTLSRLVEQALEGEEILIARAGKPVVRLVSIKPKKRRLGRWKGRVRMSKNFDAPLPADLQADWEGSE